METHVFQDDLKRQQSIPGSFSCARSALQFPNQLRIFVSIHLKLVQVPSFEARYYLGCAERPNACDRSAEIAHLYNIYVCGCRVYFPPRATYTLQDAASEM